ncbi:unnamed protein product [Photorhabdus laumondii subsp. laumondii TTO1]|uniref:Photorhabdus luminescens subsp. laumondii TTO1 complete genome segment 13/17 n=1 Tax=Photorhabdus laumondii subsp. laumondii (strain DSM 15139 / CIP 105565 / TT01) TaxID=243265 RepID=Q7N0Q0_PHOLL|nr:unnamed protein product [Photorhabdus laumondii subsp. laumondii TTO1]
MRKATADESFSSPYQVRIMSRSYHLSISDKNGSEGTKCSVEVSLYSILYNKNQSDYQLILSPFKTRFSNLLR